MALLSAHSVRTLTLILALGLVTLPGLSAATTLAPMGAANPVIAATTGNTIQHLGEAIAAHPGAVDQADALGRTALHYAARLGKTEAVAMLLEAGAEPDPADRDGYTPLMRAVTFGHADTAQRLLDAGADRTRPLPTGLSLEDAARESGDAATVELLTTP